MRHRIRPIDYYKFGLYRPERRSRSFEYVFVGAGGVAMRAANHGIVQWDKRWFAEQCVRHVMPHVPNIAALDCGEAIPPIDAGTLPKAALFVKPADWAMGQGASRWHYRGGYYEDDDGKRLTADGLIARLLELSRIRPHVVQLKIVNHSDIACLSNGALCTVRAMTGLKKGCTEPKLISAVLRMGIGQSAVDNFRAGGIAAPINADTGRLGAAVRDDPNGQVFDKHPDTGVPIAQRVIPMWKECVELSLRAHRAFGPPAIIGWDIVITPDGPVLLEGNPAPCLELMQMSHGMPLLSTAFADVILSHLDGPTVR